MIDSRECAEALTDTLLRKVKARYGSFAKAEEVTGIPARTLRHYAQGKGLPSLEAVVLLCEAVDYKLYLGTPKAARTENDEILKVVSHSYKKAYRPANSRLYFEHAA